MGHDPFVQRILAREYAGLPDARQEDLAAQLDCDRSLISHQLHLRRPLDVSVLHIWCDFLGSVESVRAIARRVGHDVVPLERRAAPITLERGGWELLAAAGTFGRRLGQALEDGRLDDMERAQLRAGLRAVREVVEGLLARIPEAGS